MIHFGIHKRTNANGSSRSPKGFSLVELLMVILILGILAAIAFPMLSQAIPNYQLRGAARELAIDFKKARAEAVRQRTSVLIEFNPGVGENGFYRVFIDENQNNQLDAGEKVLKTKHMPEAVELLSDFTAGYNSRGLPISLTGVEMRLHHGDKGFEVTRSSAGGVRLGEL